MPSSSHNCPATGCDKRVPSSMLMCPRHWRGVPKPLQREIYAAWNYGRPRDDHGTLCARAIQAVNARGSAEAPTNG